MRTSQNYQNANFALSGFCEVHSKSPYEGSLFSPSSLRPTTGGGRRADNLILPVSLWGPLIAHYAMTLAQLASFFGMLHSTTGCIIFFDVWVF
jgi:hypothetical protein